MNELENPVESPFKDKMNKAIWSFIKEDRDHIEHSKKAFVSFIRSYKEHELKYIFQFSKLSIGLTANSSFLFSLPRIKEILGKHIDDFEGDASVIVNQIKFTDKNKEKQFEEKKQNATLSTH